MNDTIRLREAIGSILDQIGREPLRELLFTPLEPKDMKEYLSRLSYHVAPSYLPFATDDSGTMIFHLWPAGNLRTHPSSTFLMTHRKLVSCATDSPPFRLHSGCGSALTWKGNPKFCAVQLKP